MIFSQDSRNADPPLRPKLARGAKTEGTELVSAETGVKVPGIMRDNHDIRRDSGAFLQPEKLFCHRRFVLVGGLCQFLTLWMFRAREPGCLAVLISGIEEVSGTVRLTLKR